METIKIKEPEPIILEGYERKNGIIISKKMFFVKYDNNLGYLYLEDGETLRLTPLRLKIVEQLITAIRCDNAFISGQHLLERAGAAQFVLSGVFRNSKNWRKFIRMRTRGYYCLNLYADSVYEDYIRPYVSHESITAWKNKIETFTNISDEKS